MHELSSQPPPERNFPEAGEPARAALETAPDPPVEHRRSTFDLWLWRFAVLIFVFGCASAGVVLTIFPWRAEWTDNYFLFRYPELRAVVASAFFRGICSGLGVLDIWIGFWEALHYHEDGPAGN
jgi:hypothetical protein